MQEAGEARTGPLAPAASATIDFAAAQGRRAPDFFVARAPEVRHDRAVLMLGRHPQIFMPSVKEPRFLATDLLLGAAAALRAGRSQRTVEGYLSLFEDALPEQRIGEASPQYLRSHDAAANIRALAPGARLIAILREPARFLRSFHLQMVSSGVEDQRDLAAGARARGRAARGAAHPRGCQHPQLAALLRTGPLCRAAAPLRGACSRPSRCSC